VGIDSRPGDDVFHIMDVSKREEDDNNADLKSGAASKHDMSYSSHRAAKAYLSGDVQNTETKAKPTLVDHENFMTQLPTGEGNYTVKHQKMTQILPLMPFQNRVRIKSGFNLDNLHIRDQESEPIENQIALDIDLHSNSLKIYYE